MLEPDFVFRLKDVTLCGNDPFNTVCAACGRQARKRLLMFNVYDDKTALSSKRWLFSIALRMLATTHTDYVDAVREGPIVHPDWCHVGCLNAYVEKHKELFTVMLAEDIANGCMP